MAQVLLSVASELPCSSRPAAKIQACSKKLTQRTESHMVCASRRAIKLQIPLARQPFPDMDQTAKVVKFLTANDSAVLPQR